MGPLSRIVAKEIAAEDVFPMVEEDAQKNVLFIVCEGGHGFDAFRCRRRRVSRDDVAVGRRLKVRRMERLQFDDVGDGKKSVEKSLDPLGVRIGLRVEVFVYVSEEVGDGPARGALLEMCIDSVPFRPPEYGRIDDVRFEDFLVDVMLGALVHSEDPPCNYPSFLACDACSGKGQW